MQMNEIRKEVSDRYAGENWKRRVAAMPDNQIFAIYRNMMNRPVKPKPPASNEPKVQQLSMFDMEGMR